ncbi:helix-turn-helix transcriptional regulator [Blastomonas marina]|uniref:helix-turn-helix transcriptional regulator n=1 Tax=Blastomonas marina TaxID=1867408 RepID=UPI002AC8E709|nr:helix-turn-helix transcriptional regulator [Blastomonas marina]WPZ03884.1 helix-turn-helix transcriptional regulator [Blastomonas marina]
MSPELFDFLTRLHAEPACASPMPDAADRAGSLFYDYLHAVGVEHCNYGGFELGGGTRLAPDQTVEFSGTRLSATFIEEFTEEMAAEDYVLLKANALDDRRPFAAFDIGLDTLDEVEAFNPASRQVQVECARHGIGYGTAILGNAPTSPGSDDLRFFGFAFANRDRAGGEHVRARISELQIAAFALLDGIAPRLHATVEGFGYDLTERERDVLGALAGGAQRQQIAWHFDITVHTVDMHLSNLRRKMRAQTLAEAVAKGYRYGIL